MAATAPTPEDTLAWEASHRRTAGLAGAGAAVLTLAGSLISGLSRSAVPDYGERTQTVLDTLGRAASGQPPVPGAWPRRPSTSASTLRCRSSARSSSSSAASSCSR